MTVKITVCDRRYSFSGTEYSQSTGVNLGTGDSFTDVKWNNERISGELSVYWKDLIKSGSDATTSLQGFKRKLRVKPVTVRAIYGDTVVDRVGYWTTNGNSYLALQPPFPDNLAQEALIMAESNFIKQVKSARHVWAAGEPLGDIAQAVRLLTRPLKSLESLTIDTGRKLTDVAKKIRGADMASRRLRACTDTWLAYVFGAKPLVQDVKDAAKEIDHITHGVAPSGIIRLIATGHAEQQNQIPAVQNFTFNVGSLSYDPPAVRDIYTTESVTTRILGGYRGASRGADLSFFDSAGLAPSDWVPTLYQLFPWSFVLDYFTNAGSALEGLCMGEVDFGWLQQTDRYIYTLASSPIRPRAGDEPTFQSCFGGGFLDEQTTVTRHHRSNTFEPGFRFHLPSTYQTLNLAALANSLENARKALNN
jgi:hypothetical protein